MAALAILIASGQSQGQGALTDLQILNAVTSRRADAGDEFRCQGFSERAAVREVERKFGGAFDQRYKVAVSTLRLEYGNETVEKATEFMPIGFKVTPKRCRAVRGAISDAHEHLDVLEKRLGTH